MFRYEGKKPTLSQAAGRLFYCTCICGNGTSTAAVQTLGLLLAFVMLHGLHGNSCLPGLQTKCLTGNNGFLMLQRDSLRVRASMTRVCHLCCTTICTGSTFQSVSTTKPYLTAHRWLQEKAAKCLADGCKPVSEVTSPTWWNCTGSFLRTKSIT